MQYKLEWMFKSGKIHFTYANTIEMAKEKAKWQIEDEDVILITITECRLVETLKNTVINCTDCKYNTKFDECSYEGNCSNFESWELKTQQTNG